MSDVERSGTFRLGDRPVKRLGYGAMRLSGPNIFGPPADRDAALAVLREGSPRQPAQLPTLKASLDLLAELQRQGLVRHIGLSSVTPAQISEGRKVCEIVCVQNQYNRAHRDDDALIDDLGRGPGTSSVAHLRENLAAAAVNLAGDVLRELDGVTNVRA
jgi:hypothetical protein